MRQYKYNPISYNGDATTSYNIEGDFPVKFKVFFKYILDNENSFRIDFGTSNEKYGGWLGNRLEISKNNETGECYWVKRKPNDWYEDIKELSIVKCWANGGWGQMLYIVTFDED